MPFKKKPGVVYVVGDDGYVALNVAGMPVDMFVALTGELGRQIGNTIVRNAKPSDQLGPGAWYVFRCAPKRFKC